MAKSQWSSGCYSLRGNVRALARGKWCHCEANSAEAISKGSLQDADLKHKVY